MMKKLLKFLNHERCQVIAALLCVVVLFSGLCCESQTRSVLDPNRQVTRLELMSEIETFNAQVKSRLADLNHKDQVRRKLLDIFALWTTTGQLNPGGIIPLLISLLGVGAVADNVAKRRDIKDLNNAG